MFFNRIDRYISGLFIRYFFAGLIVFVTLYVAVDFMTNMNRFEVTADLIGRFYAYAVPGIIYQMLPVACLLGTIFTLSTLNKNNELVALFSTGMSLARISTPILALVVAISGLSFWMGDRALPIITQKKNYTYYVEIRKQPGLYSTVKTNKIWFRSNNILFNIKVLLPERSQAQGLTMYYFNEDWRLMQIITADSVQLKKDTWDLAQGSVTLFTKDANVSMTQAFREKTIAMGEEVSDLQSTSQTSDMLSLKELARFIQRNKEAGLDTLRYEVDYYAKFSFAFAAFVMSFIGIPFSVSRQRSGGTAVNVGVCIGLAFVYWASYSSGLVLGRHGALSPMLAAWIPNIGILGLSTLLILRLKK